jgi:hypothetical protein
MSVEEFELGKYYKFMGGGGFIMRIIGIVETHMYGRCFAAELVDFPNLKPIGMGKGYSDNWIEISEEEGKQAFKIGTRGSNNGTC